MTTDGMRATLDNARAALERYVDVAVDEDGAMTFRHGDVPCALQGLELAEGLPVLSLTCVVGWDLPEDKDVPARVGVRAGEGLFGTLGATPSERGWDVTLRYAFPAVGLTEAALGTLLMLVVSNASALRTELV
jgi:hypothetical protein